MRSKCRSRWEHLTFAAKLEIGVLRQEAGGKRQEAGGKRQEAGGKRQEAGGRRQEAEGKRKKEGARRSIFTNMRCFRSRLIVKESGDTEKCRETGFAYRFGAITDVREIPR